MTEVSENILLHDLFGRAAHDKRLSNMADGCKLFVSLLIGLLALFASIKACFQLHFLCQLCQAITWEDDAT